MHFVTKNGETGSRQIDIYCLKSYSLNEFDKVCYVIQLLNKTLKLNVSCLFDLGGVIKEVKRPWPEDG